MSVEVRTGQPQDVSKLSDALAPDTPPVHTRQRSREHTVEGGPTVNRRLCAHEVVEEPSWVMVREV